MILTRRTLLAASLSSLGSPAKAARQAHSRTNVRYIMAAPAGSGNGDNWANAASIWLLNDLIVAAGRGGTVYVRADTGSYSLMYNMINIINGGNIGWPEILIDVYASYAPFTA